MIQDRGKQRVLVTGGAGFIGSHLVERLLNEGRYVVTVLDDFNDFYDPEVKRTNLASAIKSPDFELIVGDILDTQLNMQLARQQFDTIVHLAARAGVRPSLQYPLLYQRVNVEGTYRMLELARHCGAKEFLLGSSSSVYGCRSQVPFFETEAVSQPASPYAATKLAAEAATHAYSHLYGIKVICLRFFTVFGPRQRPDLAIHKFTSLLAAGRPVPLFGDGTAARDYTYVSDIVDGILGALKYEGSHHEIMNLGGEHPTRLIDLVTELGRLLKVEPRIEWLPDQPGDVPLTFADCTKARRLLGYEPRTSMNDGLSAFVEWFKRERAPSKAA